MNTLKKNTTAAAIAGAVLLACILIFGTLWMGRSAQRDTESAVRSVSLLYLDELAGRREEVVANNLRVKIADMEAALSLMTGEQLSDFKHLQAYQAQIKRLYKLEKFAFVDEAGLIYTSQGVQDNLAEYGLDHTAITGPEISVLTLAGGEKKVIIALPVTDMTLEGDPLTVCFMEIDMEDMLSGVSLRSQSGGTTFCNIYTREGMPLTNTVLGGLAQEDNLLEALSRADFEAGSSYERVLRDFAEGRQGEVSFAYGGIRETLSYVPVEGTQWLLTYLIRESVISEQISAISEGTIRRSVAQSLLTALVLLAMFGYIIQQSRRNARLRLERETADAESRVKHEELERRLALQEKLLAQEKHREQQEKMITALASDYWSVYYLELDKDEGVCYQSHGDIEGGFKVGQRFPYLASVTAYANKYITDACREDFLRFVQPDAIRQGLRESRVISYTYTVFRHGKESYEMVRFAGVRNPGEDKGEVHNVGACFTDVDAETRKTHAQQEALSDALASAKQASQAKTVFLSNMSHEIRTPMNAIIGLDNIALNDPDLPPRTREYLEKIGVSAEHLLGLINDILDMSRIESGRMILKAEEFSFPKLLKDINNMFSAQCAEHGLEYQCHISGHVDEVYIGDGMKLRQVLINILGNAVKFTPRGGQVELSVARAAQYDGQTTLRFRVADTGIGMSREFLPHIFDTFSQEDASATNRYGSSGLGMAITRSFVEMMNGDIQVESEKGKGSVFTVTVTLTDCVRPDAGAEDDEVRPQEMSVLVVDDDPIACEHARLTLSKAGIASDIAASGAEAIEMVRLRQARRMPYNLILVDWQMPDMDGVETTRQIRAVAGSESAIVILTAYRWDDVLEEALQAGVDSFLSKPLFAAAVMEEFKSAMKRRGKEKRPRKAELPGRRVLLAEDVQVNAEIMVMVLQMRQVEAELAANGKIAVEMFASHPPGYYDAILMDMRMPEMDGLEATQRIRAMDRPDARAIPIIALTANAFDEDVQRSMQAGLNAHLTKPVQPETLFETLENLIRPTP